MAGHLWEKKKHEKKRVLQIRCVWPKLAPNTIWDSRLLAKGAITHNPRSQSERAFKKGYYMFLRTCDIPSRNINCWVENHHLTDISSQFSPRQHWEMCLQLGYTPQDHSATCPKLYYPQCLHSHKWEYEYAPPKKKDGFRMISTWLLLNLAFTGQHPNFTIFQISTYVLVPV